ncbi:MAG: tRNA epoxyqueuosine(34) reductase QueG, partial [Ignavibacteriaceae bacterium]|nr:tRNA epoxyqueuosine(34) reductase QueG [Ignavibacteriaceae bacterium]
MKLTNEIVILKAKAVGFDLVGFAKADILKHESEHLQRWLDKNFQAGMDYMKKNFERRKDVRQILPEAKSVISLGLNYYTPYSYSNEE